MQVGDLVFEIPLGKDWFENNPWMRNSEIGIVADVIDEDLVWVLWPDGTLIQTECQFLERCNESR